MLFFCTCEKHLVTSFGFIYIWIFCVGLANVLEEIRKIFRTKDGVPAEYNELAHMAVAAKWSENDETFVEVANSMRQLDRKHDVALQETGTLEEELVCVEKHRSAVMAELIKGTRDIYDKVLRAEERKAIVRQLIDRKGM